MKPDKSVEGTRESLQVSAVIRNIADKLLQGMWELYDAAVFLFIGPSSLPFNLPVVLSKEWRQTAAG